MTFTNWDNTCPYLACRQPVHAELSGVEPDGYLLTCNHCGRRVVLRVYSGFKVAILTKPMEGPPAGLAAAVAAVLQQGFRSAWRR
jgi:hypothetical protein